MTSLQLRITKFSVEYMAAEAGWGPCVEELAEGLGESVATIKGCIGSLVRDGLGYTEHDSWETVCYYPKKTALSYIEE